jgi:transcriptional regulator with XRE-family HTH domain
MTIQDRLKQIIKSKRLKITEFANICDIPYRSVQGYLYGERMLGGNAIIKICAQLNVNPNWLLMNKGEMHQTKPSSNETTLEPILEWFNKWWEDADEKHQHWLEVQMGKCFPEYAQWLKERSQSK